jgi:hypothetical protein
MEEKFWLRAQSLISCDGLFWNNAHTSCSIKVICQG